LHCKRTQRQPAPPSLNLEVIMTEEKGPKLPGIILPPLPTTKRGYSVQISGSKNNQIAYCNGRFVFLRSLDSPDVTVFTKHLQKVNAATISPNGNWVASGDEEGQVYVWSIDRPDITKNEVKACRKVNAICWSFDSKRVCAVGDGNPNRGKVFPWDSSNSCGKVDGHTSEIIACDWNGKRPFRLATSGEDMVVATYDNIPVKFNKEFEGEDHTRYCNAVKYSPDSTMLATAGADSKIFIYDGKKPDEPIKKMASKKKGHHGSAIYCLEWSPDGKMFATGSADKTVKIWTVDDKKVIKNFAAGEGQHELFQVGIVWLEKHLLSVCLDGSLIFWDFESEKPIKKLCGHSAQITDIGLLNGVLYSVGQASKLTEWDLKTGEGSWFEGNGHDGKRITALGVLPSGSLATVGLDDSLKISDCKTKKFGDAIAVGGYPGGLVAGHKSDLVVALVDQGKLTVVVDGKVTHTEDVDYKPVCAALSPDDSELCVGDEKAKAHFYKVSDGKLSESSFQSNATHLGEIRACDFSSDGRYIATAGQKKKIHIMKVGGDGKPLNSFGWEYHQAAITSMAFSPDSKMLATGSMDESVILWKDLDTFSDKSKEVIACHVGGVVALRYHRRRQKSPKL